MKLVQLTDCHLLSNITDTAYGQINPYQTLTACLQQAISEQPDGLLFTGDISGDNSAASYKYFLALLDQVARDVPWRVIAGNHDVNDSFEVYLANHLLRAGKPWQIGNWFMHGLDSTYQQASGRVEPEQLAATSEHLQLHPHDYHWLCLHHHLVPTGSWMDRHALTNAADVQQWLTAHPHIQGVIHGHIHTALRSEVDQRPVLSAPSTCWQWKMAPDFGVTEDKPGYRVLSLHADGRWSTQVRRI